MDMEFRFRTTRFIWSVFFALMALLLISTAWSEGLGIFHLILGIFISIFTFVTTGTVWNWGDVRASEGSASDTSKRKDGDKLNRLLSRLSDEEMDLLREKLQDDPQAQYGLGDDGELVMKKMR